MSSLCYTCINNQAPFNKDTTEANICSCIDLVQLEGWDVAIPSNPPLTAQQKQCYYPRR